MGKNFSKSSSSESETSSGDSISTSEQIFARGYFCKNGDATDELKVTCDLFLTYDKYCGTNLHDPFKSASEEAGRNGDTRVDWNALVPRLRQDMRGITGSGYSAVIEWFVIALRDIQSNLGQDDVVKLHDGTKRVCEWRQYDIDNHEQTGPIYHCHRHTLQLWKDVEDLLENFKTQEIWQRENKN